MEWKFKKDIEPQGSSDGFWYDITDGGYIRPEEILDDEEQVEKVNAAVDLLIDFEEALARADLLNKF